MLIYKDNGSVCLSDPENTSEEEWKIITGAATLTGYDITDLATARKVYSRCINGKDDIYRFNPDVATQIRILANKQERRAADNKMASRIAKRAETHFGITNDLSLAGYLDVNGHFLCFSYDGYIRNRDHRDIGEVLDEVQFAYDDSISAGSMFAFMNMGNIRLGTYGINVSVCPNEKQWRPLMRYMRRYTQECYVDLSTFEKGNHIATLTYDRYTLPTLPYDLSEFFRTGLLPQNTVEH